MDNILFYSNSVLSHEDDDDNNNIIKRGGGINIKDTKNIDFTNIKFLYNKASLDSAFYCENNCEDFKFSNITVKGNRNGGIGFINSYNLEFENCNFIGNTDGFKGSALQIIGPTSNIVVKNSYFSLNSA